MSAPLPASSVLQIGSHTEGLVCSDTDVARSLSTPRNCRLPVRSRQVDLPRHTASYGIKPGEAGQAFSNSAREPPCSMRPDVHGRTIATPEVPL